MHLAAAAMAMILGPSAAATGYTHFEARHTHSITITPDGRTLLALNTPDARLSVFDISNSTNPEPVLIAEIPVGLEPVSVRARTNDEAWVVSELGDSVAVVSLSRRVVIDTLPASDEPADVVFAQGKAFVTCARNNLIRVFDAASRVPLPSIAVEGNYPRALAASGDGTKVYAAFLLSGNNTTILRHQDAPNPPAPTNTSLPTAPKTALIVRTSDSRIRYTVLDRDVVEIDATSGTVARYFSGVGTNLLDLTVHPQTGDLWVANSEARNLIAFEPALRGHVADHRLTKLTISDGTATVYDLHPTLNYFVFPNQTGLNTSIAQPTGAVFSADGSHLWVAGFNSDRLAKVSSATGQIVARVNVRTSGNARQMRGPRALAWQQDQQRLFVLNKLANTISTVSTADATVLSEVPTGSYDPMPAAVREGRGFLFDARLSGNGTISCATCHLDGDVDGLAWDLGDRGGTMDTVIGKNLSLHDETPRTRNLHPMKGPMVTQTLRGMQEGAPFHWRGDRPTLQTFNPTFNKLMAGPELASADIDAMVQYLLTLKHHPNPYLRADGTMPLSINGGNPHRGKDLFEIEENHCTTCHNLPPGIVANPSLTPVPSPLNNVDLPSTVGSTQPVKNPSLATTYQRFGFNPRVGQVSPTGFGMLHDGTGFALPTVHPYSLSGLSTAQDTLDLTAFMLAFANDTAPVVGRSITITAANATRSETIAELALLEGRSGALAGDLVARGTIGGKLQSYVYDSPSGTYIPDTETAAPLARAALLASISPDDALTFVGTRRGEGVRLGRDRNANGIPDRNEAMPRLEIDKIATTDLRLRWPAPSTGWLLQWSTDLDGSWRSMTRRPGSTGTFRTIDESTQSDSARFYRLNRTW
jgi:DNA-binding beta-propeller fold protein YncE